MRFVFASMLIWLVALGAEAQTEAQSAALLNQAFDAAEAREWDRANRIAAQIPDPTALILIEWVRLRSGDGGFEEYRDFLAANDDWPGLQLLRRRGEASIPPFYRPSSVVDYFADVPPQTGTGALRLAEALIAQGQVAAANEVIKRAWTDFRLSREEEDQLAGGFPSIVADVQRTRLNNRLWDGHLAEARRMLPRVDTGYRLLAEARIALQNEDGGVDARINAVPDQWQNHPGLAFDRFQWRIDKGRWDDAEQFITDMAVAGAELGRPEEWSNRRRGFARRAMRAERYEAAYAVASNHGLSEGSHYADLEWIAGYVALRKLNNPGQAVAHFTRFDAAVGSPISKARAGYWLGRAYEALGSTALAQSAYQAAAAHQTAYYGQLAAERIGAASDPALTGRAVVEEWRRADVIKRSVVRAGVLLMNAGDVAQARRFFAHLAETLPAKEMAQLADMAVELGHPYVALGVTKQAALRGIVIPSTYFPVTDLAGISSDLPAEVIKAIARRESELRVDARSPAGALGLMQLMPGTARDVAGDLGLGYERDRLTRDWRYNATLGSEYLEQMLRRYDGSYLLAFVAYNAGPARADAWIQQYGDPRSSRLDAVDWVEGIPFRETRNYVMRVMESLHVYRARLSGAPPPLQISQDLKEGFGAF